MNKLKLWFLLSSSAVILLGRPARSAQGGNYTLTKDLWGASGSAMLSGGNYTLNDCIGEQNSQGGTNRDNQVLPGYCGGHFGNGNMLHVVNVALDSTTFTINGMPYGIPLQSAAHIQLSDQIEMDTLQKGVAVITLQDHLGQVSNQPFAAQLSVDPSDPSQHTLLVIPNQPWQGNTLYSVAVSPALQSVDGFPADQNTDFQFMTLLDPHQQNIIYAPLGGISASGSGTSRSPVYGNTLSINIPADALSDYFAVLTDADPLHNPISVDPQAVSDANSKALVSGKGYSSPVAMQEISFMNVAGQKTGALTRAAQISFSFDSQNGLVSGTSAIRAGTLRLYTLDQDHHLWVEMPDSTPKIQTVSGSFTQSAVFALIGGPAGDASDVYVFPNPWRPHGPNQGNSAGQTGTDQGGLTFSNLPSECTIRIYTISGEKVRELHHSDLNGTLGQEKWDGNTSGGSHAASGVYLWRVESDSDSKNGKLMIIR